MTDENYNLKLLPPSLEPWQAESPPEKQIVVLMSGGVDSSVTAHLLKKQGWQVLGITMKIPMACDGSKTACCGAEAAFVCNELNIPHYFVDVTEAFQKLIIENFRDSYSKGQTPNPCVDCNSLLKFSLLWDFIIESFNIEYLATGHYARVNKTPEFTTLLRAADKTKDQSYFLYGISPKKLDKLILPLGELTKSEVRSLASEIDLSVAEKAESMELCFAAEGDYRKVLPEELANRSGDMTDMEGNVIGTHQGVANYTIGQRRGIGFAGGIPLYVGRIDPVENTIALGTREQLMKKNATADRINIFIPEKLAIDNNVYAKIRSYNNMAPCKIVSLTGTQIGVEFDEAQFAPTPGQKLVLYDDCDNIIAGGTII